MPEGQKGKKVNSEKPPWSRTPMRKKNRESEDILYFGEKYFKHFLTEKKSEFHRDIFETIEKNETDRIDILAPRGHAKSTWLSIIYPIWKICYNRETEMNLEIIDDPTI